ncbi:MAG: cytochrome c-type biogenesis protein CcmH [Gammaproteobacteria bacterium]|nr:MAG: cytochrome c-type biogenesis protein CcmH [Gammaproteobacteria bacterium]
MKPSALFLAFLLLLPATAGAIDPRRFDDPEQEARYYALIGQLRCLVCQNESLAASSADLAQDLRREIQEMIQAGRTDQEIIDFLVQRYGDFVLYRPPVKPSTLPLWLGPGLLLLAGLGIAWRVLRRRPAGAPPPVANQAQVHALLEEDASGEAGNPPDGEKG